MIWPILEARAEIQKYFRSFFWFKWRHPKVILKLSDLYWGSKSKRKKEWKRERDVESVIQLSLWMNQPAEKRKRFLWQANHKASILFTTIFTRFYQPFQSFLQTISKVVRWAIFMKQNLRFGLILGKKTKKAKMILEFNMYYGYVAINCDIPELILVLLHLKFHCT